MIVLWRCQCGKNFPSAVWNATKSLIHVCRACQRRGKSRLEFKIAHLVRGLLDMEVTTHHGEGQHEVDLYLPVLDWAFELDPYASHSKRVASDTRRLAFHRQHYSQVVRVREEPLPAVDDSISVPRRADATGWANEIAKRVRPSGHRTLTATEIEQVLTEADAEWRQVVKSPPSPALADHPDVAREFIKNLTNPGRTPDWTAAGASDRCLWRCHTCKHEWKASAGHRTGAGRTGCPPCALKANSDKLAVAPMELSMSSVVPPLAREFVRNLDRPHATTGTMYPQSNDRCEWQCSQCNKRWEAPAMARFQTSLSRCSGCNNKEAPEKRRANEVSAEALKWEDRLKLLRGYAAREGHAVVPHNHFEDGVNLGEWVATQRRRRATIRDSRCQKLEAVPGWVWHKGDAAWEEGWQRLLVFVERDGHASVAFRHFEGSYPLGRWVTHQRQQFSKGLLLSGRITRLEALPGWQWRLRGTSATTPIRKDKRAA